MTRRQIALGGICFLVLVGMKIAGNLDVLVRVVVIVLILLLLVYLALPYPAVSRKEVHTSLQCG